MKIKSNTLKNEYVSPSIKEQLLQVEGVLCASGKGTFPIYYWEDDGLGTVEF